MAKRVTDNEAKKIVEYAIETEQSTRAIARHFKRHPETIKDVLSRSADFEQKCAQKKEQNSKTILEHMDSKTPLICKFIDMVVEIVTDIEVLKNMPPVQLVTIMGIIIDKFTKNPNINLNNKSAHNDLVNAIKKAVKDDN